MKRKIKSILSKVNFILNRNPKIVKYRNVNYRQYIPEPYKAVFLLCADFELAWGWHFSRAFRNPEQVTMKLSRISRKNIPVILKLCDEYNIPITWATVGHLLMEGCNKIGDLPHSNLKRLPNHENQYWSFQKGDWFDDDPCTNWETSPAWYAPDLIKMILHSKARHEIACHTFSHIDCRDEICSPEILVGEVEECQRCAQKYGVKLESFVHPGHTIGNLDTLERLGFTSFRTDYDNILGYPQKHANGLWEFKSTMELTLRKEWSPNYHIYRYKKIIERACRHHRVCYYWFHPTINPLFLDKIMPAILEFIDSKRTIMWATTAKDYVTWLREIND